MLFLGLFQSILEVLKTYGDEATTLVFGILVAVIVRERDPGPSDWRSRGFVHASYRRDELCSRQTHVCIERG